MRTRLGPWMALLGLAALLQPAPAADKAPAKPPMLIVRVESLDGLLEDIFYLAAAAGKSEETKQAEALVKQLAGPKGIEGFDTKKPLGAYGKLGPNGIDSQLVIMLPVADEESALAFLHRFIQSEKGDDGVHTIKQAQAPFPLYFRFANGYAYLTAFDKSTIDKARLLGPGAVLAPGKVGTLSATINLDQVPNELKQLVIGQVELQAASDKENTRPGETPAQQYLRGVVLDEATAGLKQVLTEGGAVDVRLDVDKHAAKVGLTAKATALADSKLAGMIASLGTARSVAAGLASADSAVSFLLHASLTPKLRKALTPVIEEGAQKALKEERDANKRKLVELWSKAFVPTLKAAELDAGLSIRGPGPAGKFGAVIGMKVQDGTALEQALKESVKNLPEPERKNAKVDFAKEGEVDIHQFKADDLDAGAKEILGDDPFYLAVRNDAVFASVGANGLQLVKKAIATEPKAAPIAQLILSFHRIAKLMQKDTPGAVAAAKKAFAKDLRADKMRLTLTGGKALTFHASTDVPVIHFFALVDEARKNGE